MHASGLVRFVEGGLYPEAHVAAQVLGRPAEGGRLPEHDTVVKHALVRLTR